MKNHDCPATVASVMSEEAILDASTAKRLIVRRWLYWGVVPVVVALVATLVCSRLVPPKELSEIQVQSVLEIFLAIAAGLFLLGFWIDGYRLNPERLARAAIAAAAGREEQSGGASGTGDNPHGPFVRSRVVETASVVTVLGFGMGATAVGEVIAGGTLRQGAMLVVLSALYELYVLSRHGHYRELIDGYRQIMKAYEPDDEDEESEDE